MLDRRTLMLSAGALAASGAPAVAQGDGYAPLDAAMHKLVDDHQLAGVVTLVARKGKLRHVDAYGRLDASKPAPVRSDSIFRLASMTKPIIGVAMMMLWEEGRWTLDDPVAKHIPQFAGLKVGAQGVPQRTPMTMRQLMSHTAGFGTLADYANVDLRGGGGDLQAMIDKLASMPLKAQPGTDWSYGPCVDIQGYVIEKLSGQGLDVFLKTRIFDPLQMPDTGFWVEASKSDRVARVHTYADGVVTPMGAANTFPTSKPRFLSGGGGLFGTAPDYWRFCQMLLDGGKLGAGPRLLKSSTVKLMHTDVLAPGVEVDLYSPDSKGQGFGLDFAIVEDPALAQTAKAKDSFYWGGAFGTWFWIDPVHELIFVGMIQNLNGSTPGRGTPAVREISAQAIKAMIGY